MSRPWVIVGCGLLKARAPAPVADLYWSSYARTCVAWARSVTDPQRLLVLSAKYGLIDGRTVIAPYDVTWASPQAVTAAALSEQIARFALTGPVITLAGAAYRRRLDHASGGTVQAHNPFVDLLHAQGSPAGMGHQMQTMRAWTGRVPPR